MKKLFLCIVFALSFVPAAFAFFGDVDPIPATLHTDREIEITGVTSEGYIQGTDTAGQKKFLFKDIDKIEFVNGLHTVTLKDGKKYELKFGLIKTHYTSPTFDCMIKNPTTGNPEEAMLDPTTIKSLAFKAKTPSATAADTPTAAKPTPDVSSSLDRKNPAAVAQALLTAIRANDSTTVVSLLNAVNQKKISPKEVPEMMKELAEKVGPAEKVGAVKAGPSFKGPGTACVFVRTAGAETYVIMLTKEGEEYLFEDINSPDTAQWEKLPELK